MTIETIKTLPDPPSDRVGWPWNDGGRETSGATRTQKGPPWPRITIVTPSYNQGEFLEETIRSVLMQDYPNLEYILVDDFSSDGSLDVARRYEEHVRIIALDENRGQRDAINRGFGMASGEIFGFLNSDDTYLPGTLFRIAEEFLYNPSKRIITGRCRFVDGASSDLGREHRAVFENHKRMLKVWLGHTIPQPSTFWLSDVWHELGPMKDQKWVDYGLFCAFSQKYSFHVIDEVLSTYRLHEHSQTVQTSFSKLMTECIPISRRFWRLASDPSFVEMMASLGLEAIKNQDVRSALADAQVIKVILDAKGAEQ